MIDLNPPLRVVCRPKGSSGAIREIDARKMSPAALIARQFSYRARKFIVHLFPSLAAIRRPKHCDAAMAPASVAN
jgi:hypothetical protein